MLLASLELEKEPLQWAEFPVAVVSWIQNAGGLAALGLLVWLLVRQLSAPRQTARRSWPYYFVAGGLVLAFLGYGGFFFLSLMESFTPGSTQPAVRQGLLTLAGAVALLVVSAPMLLDVGQRFSRQRIWALARLSWKEAIRSRVVFVFFGMALIFLFAGWFIPPNHKDQLRNYVGVVYGSLTILFVVTASLLGALSIPADVKSQAIHTVVTKPVERFEIALGRFLGYGLLLTVALAVLSGLSLLYLARGISQEARQESYKARLPLFAELRFFGTKESNKGENVGREWDYRSYISGHNPEIPNAPQQYAAWHFDSLPAFLGNQETPVRFEFTFDIFRLTKGTENRGVFCTFAFADGRLDLDQVETALKLVRQERNRLQEQARKKQQRDLLPTASPDDRRQADQRYQQRLQEIEGELIRTYGVHEVASVEVTDYHTQQLDVPAAVFAKLNELEAQKPRVATARGQRPPLLQVLVNVVSDARRSNAPQMVGMARRDLYLLVAEQPFWANFFKGLVGLWALSMLVLGVAVACSTYLSGIISWLCTIFLVGAGLFAEYIQQLAEGKTPGGGPLEAGTRLFHRLAIAAPLDETPATAVVKQIDEVYRWWLRRFVNIIPDISRFDLQNYVASGFDIPWSEVLLLGNLLPLLGYLLPWALAAYYMMKYREVANPT